MALTLGEGHKISEKKKIVGFIYMAAYFSGDQDEIFVEAIC